MFAVSASAVKAVKGDRWFWRSQCDDLVIEVARTYSDAKNQLMRRVKGTSMEGLEFFLLGTLPY